MYSNENIAQGQGNFYSSMQIKLLTRENYDTWKIQVEALHMKNGTGPYVSGESTKPTADDLAHPAAVETSAINK